MKFSKSTTYGLRAIANLLSSDARNISSVKSLKVISREEKISLKYLEQLFSKLKKAKIINSTRGVNGGYYLEKKINNINLLNVLEALGEEITIFQCINKKGEINCGYSKKCGAIPVLQKVQIAIGKSLKKMKLEDLIK